MDYAFSVNTVRLSLESVCHGGTLKGGADHLKNHPLRSFIIWLNSLVHIETEAIIKRKEDLLDRSSWQITGQIINATKNSRGQYECAIYLNTETFLIRQSECDQTLISDKNNPCNVGTLRVRFQDLKIMLLERFIQMHLTDPISVNLGTLDLTDIDLTGVKFTHTKLSVNNLKAVIAQKGDLRGASLVENIDINACADLVFRDVKMDGHMLVELILVQMTLDERGMSNEKMFHGVDFSNQNLSKLPLANVDFTGSNFTDAVLDGANLNAAKLINTNLRNTSFKGTSLIEADFFDAQINDKTNFMNANLHGVVQLNYLLTGKKLSGVSISLAQIMQLSTRVHNFTGVECTVGARHVEEKMHLAHLIFNSANLIEINLCNADLTGSSFVDANLSCALVDEKTVLCNTNLTNANLSGMDLRAVRIDSSSKIQGIQLERARLSREWVQAALEQHVDLDGVNLEGLDLRGLDLRGISLTDARLKDAKLTGTRLNRSGVEAALSTRLGIKEGRSYIDLQGIQLVGADADHLLNLTDINFSHADLSGATVAFCDFTKTNLFGANFSGVEIKKCTLLSIVDADTVIVSDNDCKKYEAQFKNRLHSILAGIEHHQVEALSVGAILTLKQSVFFPLSRDYSLTMGLTNEDGGAQDLFFQHGLDSRTHASSMSLEDRHIKEKMITDKLQGNGFVEAQKTLFHWSRSALWTTLKVPYYLLMEDKFDAMQCATEQTLFQIYLTERPNTTRLKESLMRACFDAIAESQHFIHKFPHLQKSEKKMVEELFLSKEYKW